MTERTPTIVVVDDAAEVRSLVRMRLRLSGRFDVLGEGADGSEAIALAEKHRPDLMLLDVSMPGTDGLTALPRVREVSPDTRVVFYSGFEEQGLMQRAGELGATGFVEKSLPIDGLADRLVQFLPEPGQSAGATAPEAAGSSGDQQLLDEHLERFREVFDQAAIGMATVTLAGSVVRANRALAQLLNRPAETLVGAHYGDLTDGQEELVDHALEDIRSRPVEVFHFEHGVRADAGRQVRVTMAPVRDSEGRPLYIFLQVQDVTAERAATEELRRSEERFRLLVEAVEDYAIFMLNPDGTIASWNAGAQRSQGYDAHEIIGQHFRVFYPPEVQAAKHPEHELEVALRDGHYEEDGWRIRKDGSRFWASVVITAVYDEKGHHVGFAKVTRDITERRDAEEEIRQNEERFRLLVETVRDYAIFMLNPDGTIASWNRGAQRTKGYAAHEIIGQHFRIFYPPHLQAAKHPEHELELAIRDGQYQEEGWRIRKDGSRFWANVLITAIRNSEGELLGFTKVTRDNTERRRLEQEREHALEALGRANTDLESLNAKLRQAADDQAQFLAVTAHELRTPIGVLGGTAETLSRHWDALLPEERSELLDGMTSSTSRLRRLLADLLTASRLQANALRMALEPVEVAAVVADSLATVRRTNPSAELVADVPAGLVVRADRDRLAQAVENLLTNALRHGVPPVVVTTRANAGDASEAPTVDVRVHDQGEGVAEAVRPRLFERFATGMEKGGTGLGLYIVRELARAQGGDAFYEPPSSSTHAGAFVLRMPAPTSTPDPGSNPTPPPAPTETRHTGPAVP